MTGMTTKLHPQNHPMMLKLTLPLPIPSKKNTTRIVGKRLIGSPKWKAYEAQAIYLLKRQYMAQLGGSRYWAYREYDIELYFTAYYPGAKYADVFNIADGVSDLIQDAGIIENDRQIVRGVINREIGMKDGPHSGTIQIEVYALPVL